VLEQPDGEGGFGYDPLFEILEYHTTFGRLGPVAKGVVSHRARALREFRRQLQHLQRKLGAVS
jgi:XTP/dITP diphosphohydrolase